MSHIHELNVFVYNVYINVLAVLVCKVFCLGLVPHACGLGLA